MTPVTFWLKRVLRNHIHSPYSAAAGVGLVETLGSDLRAFLFVLGAWTHLPLSLILTRAGWMAQNH